MMYGGQDVSRCHTRCESHGTCDIIYAAAKHEYDCPLWLSNPEETSPESPRQRYQRHHKKAYTPKNLK